VKLTMIKFGIKLQRGVSLITAIFLLVVLGTLGTMMVTFFAAQQQSSALDVMGSRAYQAARAGVEWAAFNVAQMAPPGTLWPGCAAIPAPLFAAGALAGDLAPFTVTLTCVSIAAVEAGNPIVVYDITSTAVFGGSAGNADFVERVTSAKLVN
jgi:MSHA biogenesis protein MshP